MGVQQMDGSSTAAAPSASALTHFAIVWEALLIESETAQIDLIVSWLTFFIFTLRRKHTITCHVEVLCSYLRWYQRSCY